LSKQYPREWRRREELTDPIGVRALNESTVIDPRDADLNQMTEGQRSCKPAPKASDRQFVKIDPELKAIAGHVNRVCPQEAGDRVNGDRPRIRGNA
jgi:hypothetical protein